MLFDCLTNIIRLNECGTVGALGSVAELAGVDTAVLDSLATLSAQDAAGQWAVLQARAARALYARFDPKNKIKFCHTTACGNIALLPGADSPPATPVGLLLAQNVSPYLDWHILRLRANFQTAGTATLTIYHAQQGIVLHTHTFTHTQGKQTIVMDANCVGEPIYIALNNDFALVTLPNPLTLLEVGCGCSTPTGIQVAAAQGAPPHLALTNEIPFQVDYALQCSIESYICANKKTFLPLWWALLAAEILSERLHTHRHNAYTQPTDEIEKQYQAAQARIAHLAESLRPFAADPCCQDCTQALHHRWAL